ncbi:MAG: hypothetical protein MJY44_02780 [Bacteroidales bacterium]|nr:hypothetical protein [Bacteroidales bacterium]
MILLSIIHTKPEWQGAAANLSPLSPVCPQSPAASPADTIADWREVRAGAGTWPAHGHAEWEVPAGCKFGGTLDAADGRRAEGASAPEFPALRPHLPPVSSC